MRVEITGKHKEGLATGTQGWIQPDPCVWVKSKRFQVHRSPFRVEGLKQFEVSGVSVQDGGIRQSNTDT